MNITWESYGVDIDDAGFWDRYAEAQKCVATDPIIEADPGEEIRAYCAAFRQFFCVLIGKDASDEILKEVCDNKKKMDEVYASLLQCVHAQRVASSNRMAKILAQYAPKRRGQVLEKSNGTETATSSL